MLKRLECTHAYLQASGSVRAKTAEEQKSFAGIKTAACGADLLGRLIVNVQQYPLGTLADAAG